MEHNSRWKVCKYSEILDCEKCYKLQPELIKGVKGALLSKLIAK